MYTAYTSVVVHIVTWVGYKRMSNVSDDDNNKIIGKDSNSKSSKQEGLQDNNLQLHHWNPNLAQQQLVVAHMQAVHTLWADHTGSHNHNLWF